MWHYNAMWFTFIWTMLLVYTINLAFYFRVEYSTVSHSPLAVALSLTSSAVTQEAVLFQIQCSISGQMWLHWVSWFYSGNQSFFKLGSSTFCITHCPQATPNLSMLYTHRKWEGFRSGLAGLGIGLLVASQAADSFYLQILMMSFSAIISIELFPTV